MELTDRDIGRISRLGYNVNYFVEYRNGYKRLKNVDGHCVFLDIKNRRCRIYKYRPIGCRIYPVIYDEELGFRIDDICPAKKTIDSREFRSRVNALKWVLKQLF